MARRHVNTDAESGYSASRRKEPPRKRTKEDKGFHKTTQAAETRLASKQVVPQTDNQQILWDTLNSRTLTMVTGPAGSGKTYLAVHAAAQALARKEVNQILVSRTMATVGAEIGHLPGTEVEKMAPYVAPMLEALNEFFGKYEVEKMIKAEIIKIVPVALLRGYTFKHSYVLIDEAQNMTAHELKTVLTRLGEGSKMAVMADVAQVDCTHRNFNSGLLDFMNRLLVYTQSVASEFIGVVTLTNDDVVRSAIVREILEIYDVEVC